MFYHLHSETAVDFPLRRIFEYLSQSDNAQNARVCRGWMSAALERVWTKVDVRVFESLVDLDIERENIGVRSQRVWVCQSLVCDLTLVTDVSQGFR